MENIQSLISGCWDRGKIHPEGNSNPWEGDNNRTTHFYYCWHFLCLQKRELLNKKSCVLNPQMLNVICKHFCLAPVWAREGSPQSPQFPAPTAQVQALAVTPLSSQHSSKLQKMMHLVLDHSVLCFLTLQSISSTAGLCRAGTEQQHHNTTFALPGSPTNGSCYPPTASSTHFFSLSGAFWAITPADHQSVHSSGWQKKAECMFMRGNILLMQRVNQGDKFKSFLCHYYRQVLQSFIRSIENFKRYGNESKIGCFLWRTCPFLWCLPAWSKCLAV